MRTESDVLIAAPESAAPIAAAAAPPRRGRGRHRDPDPGHRWSSTGLGVAYPIAAASLLAVTAGLSGLALAHVTLAGDHAVTSTQLLTAAATTVAATFFVLCLVRWGLAGDAGVLGAGVATLVFGVSCVAIPELALPLIGTASATASWARAAQAAGLLTTLTLLALVALDVAPSQSESRRRPGWVVTAALTVAGVGTVVLHTVHGLLPAIPTPEQSAVGHGAPVAASLILAGAWLLAGTACGARGLWQGRPLLTWTGLMLVALSVSYGGLAVADRPGHIWILGSALLRLSGLLVAVLGASLELERAFVEQRARLFDSELSARTNETRWQLHRARRRDRDHDLRSALVAIEGAALTLERHYDTLTDDERDRLTSMLSSGVDRLQSLVVDDSRPRASFALAEVVRPFVGNLMAEGESVAVEVPEDMVAVGSPAETAEVVRQLLDNARRRAPGGTITVRGEHDGGAIVLRVHGRGQDQEVPGIGRGASTAPGRALAGPSADLPMGLHVASRLMRDQGGDLWVEAQGSGRCSFALSLPAPALGAAGA